MPGHRNIDNLAATCVLSYMPPFHISRRNRVLVNAGRAGATAWQDPPAQSPLYLDPNEPRFQVAQKCRYPHLSFNHVYSPSNTL